MKRILSVAAALAVAAVASFSISAPAIAAQPTNHCLTHTIFGVPLAEPHCGPTWVNTNAPRPSYFKQKQNAPVAPVTPAPVDPVEVCTTIPGAPIYENQIVGYTDGAPIRERQKKYRTVLGQSVWLGEYVWVTVGYEQVPVHGDVQVGNEPDDEVCELAD